MRRQSCWPVMVACALTACVLVAPGTAVAGSWIQVSCPSGMHAVSSSPGWSTFAELSPDRYDGASTECGESRSMSAWLSTIEAAHMYDAEALEYQPPAGSTLDGGWLELNGLAAGYGPGAYAEVALYAPSVSSPPFWSCAYEACPQGTGDTYSGQVNIPAGTGGDLDVTVICNGSSGSDTCKEGTDSLVWANVEVKEAHLLLTNDSTPSASGFGGSLLEPGARGPQQLSLTATDPSGPGVYSVAVEIEGVTAYTGIPDTNDGACVPTGTTNVGVLMFASQQPCLQIEALKLPVETAVVPDGQHPVKVVVTDAAGNKRSVLVGNITTHNAPVASTAPSILAPNGVSTGVALLSTPGEWSAPTGAGTITDVYQWQQCSATGKECQAIPGATAATYTPSQADAGHTLKLAVTGLNNDGQATEESAATGVIAAAELGGGGDPPSSPAASTSTPSESTPTVGLGTANGTGASQYATIKLTGHSRLSRRYANRALSISGQLMSSTGQPIVGATIEVFEQTVGGTKPATIARATTGPGGRFVAKVPAGPSRVIELDYRAFANAPTYAAQAKITESVSAGIVLHVTPRRTSPTGTVVLSGQVHGPIPAGGVNLEIEVWYQGHWVAFHAPHTRADGRFSFRYQFQGATGRFPFRVRALASQNGFAYRAGYSNRVEVATR